MGIAGKPEANARQPIDDHPDWAPIYDHVARVIGEPEAWSWFAHCRFIGITNSTLTISHHGAFQAAECLNRYGYTLAKAAAVKAVKVYRSGGFRPLNLKGEPPRSRKGFETYELPNERAQPEQQRAAS